VSRAIASDLADRREVSHKTMRMRIVARLLCLMIVVGSLDRVPDPPAVKAYGDQTNTISRADHHVPVTAKKHTTDCANCARHFRADLFWFGQIFESREPASRLSFVRRASDASPPSFS
jgi:hypothetical protein